MAEVDPRIVRYLKDHKDKFDIDLLKRELSKAGFPHEEIEAAEESLLEEEREHALDFPPFPDPVFEEVRKEAEEVRKEAEDWKKKTAEWKKEAAELADASMLVIVLFSSQ